MSDIQIMEITLIILSIAILFGAYALNRLHELVKSYSNGFGQELGKVDATTHKLDEIKAQIAQTVEITESIKTDIGHVAWREKELELLKREKLEDYLICYYTEKENLNHKMREAFFDVKIEYDRQAESKLSMLHILYLPELDEVHACFLMIHAEFMSWVSDGMTMMLEQQRAGTSVPRISSEHMENYPILLQKLNKCTLAMESKVQEIGRAINNA